MRSWWYVATVFVSVLAAPADVWADVPGPGPRPRRGPPPAVIAAPVRAVQVPLDIAGSPETPGFPQTPVTRLAIPRHVLRDLLSNAAAGNGAGFHLESTRPSLPGMMVAMSLALAGVSLVIWRIRCRPRWAVAALRLATLAVCVCGVSCVDHQKTTDQQINVRQQIDVRQLAAVRSAAGTLSGPVVLDIEDRETVRLCIDNALLQQLAAPQPGAERMQVP
jgi:hypothetical protein